MSQDSSISFVVREIKEEDLRNGLFDTLSNLSSIGDIINRPEYSKEVFSKVISNPVYKILVAVKDDGQVVGTITLLLEQKFIHDGGIVGHIEDVATRKGFEGMGIGSALVRSAIDFARETNCYKVILDCSEHNVPFYEKLGFRKHSVCMRLDLK